MFETSNKTWEELSKYKQESAGHKYKAACLDSLVKMEMPRYIRELVKDAAVLKNKWFVTVHEGEERFFHCIQVSEAWLLEWKDKTLRDRDSNLFTDRIKLTYDKLGGFYGKKLHYFPLSCKPHTDYFPPEIIRRAKVISESELLERYPRLKTLEDAV